MELAKRYDAKSSEAQLRQSWQENGIYHFDPAATAPVYAVDTPPPTVSGHLHIGHVYSYSHADFIVRYRRMQGDQVYYPMGFDDNGLPTERLVEKRLGRRAVDVGRAAFIAACLQLSEALEQEYRTLWQHLGLSLDWRYTYRTIDDRARRIAQWSFLDLYRKGLAYRQQAPTLWCPECQTAIAQAEVNDLTRTSELVTLAFTLPAGERLPIATTRPELLPACVAVFVHPDDIRYQHLIGQTVAVPYSGQRVPLLADPGADPAKGTGVVMCCTFGDVADIGWWRTHALPLRVILDKQGRLTAAAGDLAGMTVPAARAAINEALTRQGLLLERQLITQNVRVHERCDTPVETLVTPQWYVRVLDHKAELLAAGEQIEWHPPHMQAIYRSWVENLAWDWCISRQRYFGVPLPVWYCNDCGAVLMPTDDQLPIDPTHTAPAQPCACGSQAFTPERDVFDTWATSSLSPQIAGRWLEDDALYAQLCPMALRPQAHEIIRTWAFYTIVKSLYHFGRLPWRHALISGWGLAPKGTGKISKSRGGGPLAPLAAIERYTADGVRYWAASTAPGKDAIISEEKMQAGAKLVTKLWNVARFSQPFLAAVDAKSDLDLAVRALSPADRWLLARSRQLVQRVTDAFERYDYAAANHELESFFWTEFTDNYLEMAKLRLYQPESRYHQGARMALRQTLLILLKLYAPLLPYVTDAIYQALFAATEDGASIHRAQWPRVAVADARAEQVAITLGETLVQIATAVRRYKSEAQLALGAEVTQLALATPEAHLAAALTEAEEDLKSITRAQTIQIMAEITDTFTLLSGESHLAYRVQQG